MADNLIWLSGTEIQKALLPEVRTFLDITNVENTALSTWAGSSNITTIGTLSAGSVPWARLTSIPSLATSGLTMESARLLGRYSAATGAVEEITLGAGLSFSGGALVATGSGSGLIWNTITESDVASAVSNNGYIMETGGTLREITLPSSVSSGFYIIVNANAGQVRIVSNGNVIDGVGTGNNLLLDNGNTVALVAKETGQLEILLTNQIFGSSSSPPNNTVAPVISGSTTVGSVLSSTTGSWTGTPTSYSYQWQEFISSAWSDVSGETANTYTTDHAGEFRCQVVATNSAGSSSPANSNTITISSGSLLSFGWDNGSALADGSPNAEDRAWAAKYNKANSGTVTGIFARFGSDSVAGGSYKICAHAAGTTSPGTLLWSTPAQSIPAGGGLVEFTLPSTGLSGTDAAGDYWLVAVSDGGGAPTLGGSTGSSLGVNSVMANGTYSFTTPPSTWPGTDGSYDVKYDIYCEYVG